MHVRAEKLRHLRLRTCSGFCCVPCSCPVSLPSDLLLLEWLLLLLACPQPYLLACPLPWVLQQQLLLPHLRYYTAGSFSNLQRNQHADDVCFTQPYLQLARLLALPLVQLLLLRQVLLQVPLQRPLLQGSRCAVRLSWCRCSAKR